MNKSSKTRNEKHKILNSALKTAEKTGWDDDLLQELKAEYGIVAMTQHYPDGLLDLAYEFADWADAEMLQALAAKKDKGQMKITAQITFGVRARLMALSAHKKAFKSSVKYMMHPARAPYVKKMTWQTADRLWNAAGDTATDYNHYSKRILLSGVLASTTLYWLKDKSENYDSTWAFLDRRINNVLKIGGLIGRLKRTAKS